MDFSELLNDPELFGEAVTFGIIAVVFVVMYVLHKRDKQKQRMLLEEVAMSQGGRVEAGGLFAFPKMILTLDGSEAHVQPFPGSRNSAPRTIFSFQRQAPFMGKIDVSRKSFIQTRFSLWGMKTVDINSPVFNDSFKVLASEEMITMNLLSIEAQASLLGIKDLNPLLLVRDQKLTLTVRTLFKDMMPLQDFIKTGSALSRQFAQMG